MNNLISMIDFLNRNPDKANRHTELYHELFAYSIKPRMPAIESDPLPYDDVSWIYNDPTEAEIDALEAQFKASYTESNETE